MHFSWVSVLFLASVCLGSAIPENGSLTARDSGAEPKEAADAAAMKDKKVEDKSEDSDCFGPPLCCTSLATPLDPLVDALLDDLDVDVASIVRSIGLLCMLLWIFVSQSLR
jgi:hypothetical protein